MNIFKTARKRLGFTQKEIAAATGAKTKEVSDWENGMRFPSPEALAKLAELTGIDEETFIEKAGARPA